MFWAGLSRSYLDFIILLVFMDLCDKEKCEHCLGIQTSFNFPYESVSDHKNL